MPLLGDDGFVIPISPFDQPDRDETLMLASPIDDVAEVGFAIPQISLQRQSASRSRRKFRLGKNLLEQAQSEVLERVTLHVEINKCAELFGAAKNAAQAFRYFLERCIGVCEMTLRVERGELHG